MSATFVPRVACIGECMVELGLPPAERATHARLGFAGDTMNVAVYLAREAGPQASVAYVTVVGRDELSRRMRVFLRAEGLDDALVGTHARRLPGVYAIATDADGERSFSYWRERSAARTLFEPNADVLNDAGAPHAPVALDALGRVDLVHLSGITLAILSPTARERLCERLGRCRERGVRIAFDSNYRPALWEDAATAALWISRLWRLTDIGLPSADDEAALFGDASAEAVAARLRAAGVRDGAVKDGARGALPIPEGIEVPPIVPVERVVDSTAGGDSFDGAFLAARLAGRSTAEAIAAGHALAREVIGHRGAIVPRARTDAEPDEVDEDADETGEELAPDAGSVRARAGAYAAPAPRNESRNELRKGPADEAPDDELDDTEVEGIDTDISRAMARGDQFERGN